MFYILVFISLIFIFTGMYIDRKKIIDGLFIKFSKIRNKEEIDEMEAKIRELEEKLEENKEENSEIKEEETKPKAMDLEPPLEIEFEELPFADIDLIAEESQFQEIYQETQNEREELTSHNKVKMIYQYEKEGKNIDEISELMDIKKGEILLLKKLYKKS
jgi:predicted RNase H-like nuclease (RuvC/YqgF family)